MKSVSQSSSIFDQIIDILLHPRKLSKLNYWIKRSYFREMGWQKSDEEITVRDQINWSRGHRTRQLSVLNYAKPIYQTNQKKIRNDPALRTILSSVQETKYKNIDPSLGTWIVNLCTFSSANVKVNQHVTKYCLYVSTSKRISMKFKVL